MSGHPRIGPASAEPLPPPEDGKPLIVHVVLNVELWRFDAAMPRALLPGPHGVQAVPDAPNFSWVEYGMRRGLPRLVDLLSGAGVPVSVAFNARVGDVYPSESAILVEAGWEFVGHGLEQRSLLSVDDQEAEITGTLDAIQALCGTRPRGWLGPGLHEGFDTPDILRAAGVEWVSDWALDDVPVWLEAGDEHLVALPYSLELNDSVLFAAQQQPVGEWTRRVTDTVQVLGAEAGGGARVIALPLHPHLAGVPHRIGHLARVLDELRAREDTVFMAGSELADWFRAVAPPPATS